MIPKDNYFVLNPPGSGSTFPSTPLHGAALQEHQALGVRNPWRMAVDSVDGHIAMFNVGSNAGTEQQKFEEVELLSPGANFGWPYREGTLSKTFETNLSIPPSKYAPLYLGTQKDAAAFWSHADGGDVASGGLFYRGSSWPSISGELIFADHSSGKIWALDYKSAGAASSTRSKTDGVSVPNNYSVRQLVDTSLNIRQMAAGPSENEIYIAANGAIHRLFNDGAANPEAPALLSQTGIFTNLATLTPRAGLIPYKPASQLWSDRAAKSRWISVPTGEKITYSEDGEWIYPVGTVFIKHFALPTRLDDPDNPAFLQSVETRFLVHGEDGDYFYFTYQWRADGSEADLLTNGATADYSIVAQDGSPTVQTWTYPSRSNCIDCHQTSAGSVLGMKSRQLNHPLLYPSTGISANQITTFAGLGLFETAPDFGTLPAGLKSAALEQEEISLQHRVHSYLDSNCSFCHRPGSNAGRAEFDVRLTTPMSLTGILNGDPKAGLLGVSDATLITPGRPSKSILYLRDSSTVVGERMPPIGRDLNDHTYVPLLRTWVERIGYPGFDAWATAAGIQGGLNGDHDEDSVPNALEFVLGPDVDLTSLPRVVPGGASAPDLKIPITAASLADGMTLQVEGSLDLIDWFPVGHSSSGLTEVSDTSSTSANGIRTIGFTGGGVQTYVRYGVAVPE